MILLIGGNGSIGKRYRAILDYLEYPYQIFEVHDHFEDLDHASIKRALICSPTPKHLEHASMVARLEIPFLCEKPTSKDLFEAQEIAKLPNGFVVNNYAYAVPFQPGQTNQTLAYDFYNTGKDSLVFDVCQLVYLSYLRAYSLSVRKRSFHWSLVLNGKEIPYKHIELSYLWMLQDFLHGNPKSLWSVKQGLEMTQMCLDIQNKGILDEDKDFNWHPSALRFHSTSGENLQAN